MKRFILPFGTLVLLTQLTGCGGSETPPPADGSSNPSEVNEYESRRTTEREKKITPKGVKAAPVRNPK